MPIFNVKHLIPADRAELYDIMNSRGENLGRVETFMFDPETNRIAFVIASFGGIFGLREKWFAIPLEVLKWDKENNRFILDVPRETLEKAKGLDWDKWTEEFDLDWLEEAYTCFGCRPYWVSEATWVERKAPAATAVVSGNWLKVHSIIDKTGEEIGNLCGIVIDLRSGYVAYCIADFGRGAPLPGWKIIIPLQAFKLQWDGELFLAISRSKLEKAPVFETGKIRLSEDSLRSIYAYFGFSPYWENKEIWQRRHLPVKPPKPVYSYRPDLFLIRDLIGRPVRDLQYNEAGVMEDLVIDLESGFLASAVLAAGKYLDLDDRLSPLPLEVISFDTIHRVFYLSVNKETIKDAPAFDRSRLPVVDRRGLTAVYAAYGYTPYWKTGKR